MDTVDKTGAGKGFSLAEMLVTLGVLGVVVTFTISKVLQNQQYMTYRSIGKEAAEIISSGYDAYKLDKVPTASTGPKDLIPYLNYTKQVTTQPIDSYQQSGTKDCDGGDPCLMLHNGAALRMTSGNFGGTATTNAIAFYLDPDGKVTDGATEGPGKSVVFHLYYNGLLRTRGTALDNTCSDATCLAEPKPHNDPPWFSWD